jgi:1-acyl-sn-glycerol-3-phosphate acyltransferase
MNFLKNILGRLFALWALLVFVISLLLFWIPIWITVIWPEPKRTVQVFKVFAVWMKVFFTLSGVRRIFTGKEHFKHGKTFVVVCNHQSFMDVPLSSTGIPGANKTIAKIEMARIPIFGMVYKRGSVLVDRKSEESRRTSFLKMKEVLNMGLHMCIYPEGTRNRSKQTLMKFHDGAFKLAVETGHDIIPTLLLHTTEVLPTHKAFFFWPRPVEMHFLTPVAVSGKTVAALKQEVFDIMQTEIHRRQKL